MPKKQTKSMSERLKETIDNCGKTRYRIAQDTDIAESALSRFMSGERGLSMEALDRLLDYLGLEVVERKTGRN